MAGNGAILRASLDGHERFKGQVSWLWNTRLVQHSHRLHDGSPKEIQRKPTGFRMPEAAGWTIPEESLARLTELFIQTEGASAPLSTACKLADLEFSSLIEQLHAQAVQHGFSAVTLSQFRSHVRIYCRARAATD